MPIELKMLAWSVALGLVHVLLGAALTTHQRGLRWNVGARLPLYSPERSAQSRQLELAGDAGDLAFGPKLQS